MDSARYSFGIARGTPCLPDRVAEKIAQIVQGHACFCDRPSGVKSGRRPSSTKRHGGGHGQGGHGQGGHGQGGHGPGGHGQGGHGPGGHGPGGQFHRRHMHSQHPQSSASSRTREPPSGERAIRAALNKLAGSNYTSISRRVIFIVNAENVAFVVRSGLEKAYMEPEHSSLYVRLFKDVLDSADSAARQTALAVFLSDLPDESSLMSEVLLPNTDPINRYDEFCATCKVRRRIVGRGATYCGLLQIAPISDHVGATPADVYVTHERVMRKLLENGPDADRELDSCAAIEVMLESIDAVIRRNHGSLAAFRAVIRDHPVNSFPTAKCRFKVLDIMGIKKTR